MAEGLDPVLQVFLADTGPYVRALNEAIAAARDFAQANADAALAVGAVDSAAAGDTGNLADLAGAANDAASALNDLRTAAAEAAVALAAQAAAAGAAGAATGLAGALASIGPYAIAAGVALAALAAVSLFPLVASLGLVLVGIGAFAAVAIPSLSKVWAAVAAGGAAWNKLTPAEKEAATQLEGLKDAFLKLTNAVQPMVITAFTEALRIARDLMPALIPLAQAAGKALDTLLANIDGWLRSGSGQKFLHWMEVDGPHAIEIFGRVVWDVIRGVGRTFDFLFNLGTSVDHWFERVFGHDIPHWFDMVKSFSLAAWASRTLADLNRLAARGATELGRLATTGIEDLGRLTVTGIEDIGRLTVSGITELGKLAVTGIEDIGRLTVAVITGIGRFVATGLADIGRFVAQGLAAFGRFVAGAVQWFASLPGRILSALGNLGGLLVGAGQAIIRGLMSGIESMLGPLGSLVSSIAGFIARHKGPLDYDRQLLVPHGQAIMAGLMAGIASQLPALRAEMGLVTSAVGVGGSYGAGVAGGRGAGRGGGAGAGAAPPVTVNLTVQGSVLAQQDLKASVQEAVLDAWTRSHGTGFTPYGYPLR